MNSAKITITIFSQGVYCFFLNVIDVAGNVQHARRFAIFDNNNTVEISYHAENSIVVISAAENTSYLWQTNLAQHVSLFHLY